jgi:hypothetical protein
MNPADNYNKKNAKKIIYVIPNWLTKNLGDILQYL